MIPEGTTWRGARPWQIASWVALVTCVAFHSEASSGQDAATLWEAAGFVLPMVGILGAAAGVLWELP